MMLFWWYIGFMCISPEWGFFGHRLINRVAVYAVPSEMIGWYKPYIDYLSDHAVDPDKRRYATKHEAVRHYIDLDHWGTLPFDHIPLHWDKVLALNIEMFIIKDGDTTFLLKAIAPEFWKDNLEDNKARLQLVRQYYLPQYYEEEATLSCENVMQLLPAFQCEQGDIIYLRDVFSQHGIVPYHLQSMQRRLTSAFKDRNLEQVMRLSAEIGHYIGDACVPLHTTSNYNGQLTGQVGIHAFWESRIPELFAVDEFDMVVGTATYIEDPPVYFWNLVLDSHRQVDRVLGLEKELSITFPSDQQYCFEDRLNQNVRTQCTAYAKAYHEAMDRMVEDRFRVAVKALADSWYTAWVDAGQPPPPPLKMVGRQTAEDEALDKAAKTGKVLGREHEN